MPLHATNLSRNQDSPETKQRMVRADGIEPTTLAWKAKVLPLNYARKTALYD